VQPPPLAVANRTIRIECNGAIFEQPMNDALQEVALRTQADAAGRLHIEFSSAAWRPEKLLRSADSRQLGCLVHEVQFIPDLPSERTLPQRASVIVPTFNRREILLENLALLAQQTWPRRK
jgi:hypothetical protein